MIISKGIIRKYNYEIDNLRMFDDSFFRILSKDKRVIPDVTVSTNRGYINIEIERHQNRLFPKRLRYNASALDVFLSKKGMKYKNMKPIKILFLCEFDPGKKNLPIYHISDTVRETGILYDDEREYIFINGKYEGNDKIGMLVHDFKQKKAKDMYNPILKDVMKYHKENKEGRRKMCEIFDSIERRGEKRGVNKGKVSANVQSLRNIMKNTDYSLKQAMELIGIPKNEYNRYMRLIGQETM